MNMAEYTKKGDSVKTLLEISKRKVLQICDGACCDSLDVTKLPLVLKEHLNELHKNWHGTIEVFNDMPTKNAMALEKTSQEKVAALLSILEYNASYRRSREKISSERWSQGLHLNMTEEKGDTVNDVSYSSSQTLISTPT